MKIGTHAPLWRVPCLLNGRMTYIPLTAFQGNQLVLCCLPSLPETAAWLLDPQVNRFHECGIVLAVLVHGEYGFEHTWVRPSHEFSFPLLADPLRRLRRTLDLSHSLPSHRCETLFFDQFSCLQFHLVHDLNLRGISTVLEVAESNVCQRSIQEGEEAIHNSTRFPSQRSEAETPTGTYTLK